MIEMKDSGISFIGMIPSDWNVTRNKNVFSCTKELVGTASSETQLLSLTTKGIKEKDINNPEGKLPESFDTYQFVKKNDMVMCLFDLDVSAVFSGLSPYDGMISPAYRVLHCKNNIIPKFADYWFRYISDGRKFNHYAKNIRYTLNYEDFSTLPIVQAPIDRQCRIVDYLDEKCSKIDAIIEKQQTVIKKLKAYKVSVITEAVTKGLNPDVKMKDSGIKWVDSIPSKWENRKMLSILSMRVVDGPHESPELFDEGIPYISATAVVNGKIDFSLMRGYISSEYCDECDKRYKPKQGDILVIKLGASTGKVAMVETNDRFNIWVPLAAVRCNEEAFPRFVYYAFQSDYFLRQMELSWTFGTQQTLGVKTIEQLRILLPSIPEQGEISTYLDIKCSAIDNVIAHKEAIIEKLTSYKKSLIYEVVTGKKEI